MREYTPLAFTPSGVLNILSFFANFDVFPFVLNSCHLLLPASNSLFALTFLGTFGGRVGPSLTLLGSLFAWLASAGLISAAAEMIFVFVVGAVGVLGVPGVPSALRFLESLLLLVVGFISWAERVSLVA